LTPSSRVDRPSPDAEPLSLASAVDAAYDALYDAWATSTMPHKDAAEGLVDDIVRLLTTAKEEENDA
jgi:hypothetical protein